MGTGAKSNQFHLKDMMEVVLLFCVTLAACRLAGPIAWPPWHLASVQFVIEMTTASLMGGCAILASFSRKCAILFLFIFPSLICFDVGLILLLQVRVSQWTKYGPIFLQGVFSGYVVLVANCILMMLIFRWLGYRLEWARNETVIAGDGKETPRLP